MLMLLLVIGGLVALVLQNWSPVLPLVLFGTTTIALPFAVWISVFIGAGVLMSLLLQLINYRPKPAQNVRPAPQAEPDLPPPPPRREMPKPPPSEQPQSDWETSLQSEDWTTQKKPQPDFEKRSPSQPPPPPQSPPETKKAPQPNQDVYDANFRILNQPSPESDVEEGEDWGFEDEELETEYRRNWPGN